MFTEGPLRRCFRAALWSPLSSRPRSSRRALEPVGWVALRVQHLSSRFAAVVVVVQPTKAVEQA